MARSPVQSFLVRALTACLISAGAGCDRGGRNSVTVYASQDTVYAEPLFKEFERRTGVKVLAVYDGEAVKTVALANRLLAEKNRPMADVFWSNEELRTRQLASREVFRETNGWHRLGYRSRCWVINTQRLALAAAPQSLGELTNGIWSRRVVIAYPVFGSTATHFMALRHAWGESNWLNWCEALKRNRPYVVEGNSWVVQLVGRGEAWIGLTDSDDLLAGQRQGLPIDTLPASEEMVQLPNTLGLIRHSPNPVGADALVNYLREPEVLNQLVLAGALQSAVPPTNSWSQNWEQVLAEMPSAIEHLQRLFVR